MKICIPVPENPEVPATRGETHPVRTIAGPIGVIDNSKPGFEVLARAAIDELTAVAGGPWDAALYAHKPTATRGASEEVVDRLSAGAVAVLVGSGD